MVGEGHRRMGLGKASGGTAPPSEGAESRPRESSDAARGREGTQTKGAWAWHEDSSKCLCPESKGCCENTDISSEACTSGVRVK